MATIERDVFSNPFVVGSVVSVRCRVTAITPANPAGPGGAGDLVTCAVENNGNVGEVSGVTFQVSPVQCRKTGSVYGGQGV